MTHNKPFLDRTQFGDTNPPSGQKRVISCNPR